MKKLDKKFVIISIVVALFVVATITISSYAYFTIENKTGVENTITSGTMALTLTDGNEITAGNMLPGESIEKEFSVTNTGNVNSSYDIYLSEVINTFADKTDLVYEITSLDGGYNTSNQVQVPSVSSKIINNYAINVGDTHHYKLKITFLNKNENQDDNQGKIFSAKIQVNEYKDIISFNVLTQNLSNDVEVEIDYGNSLIKEYSIGNQNNYQTYNGSIHLRSNDHYNLANPDGTITIYAKSVDSNGNEIVVSKDIDNLDTLVPSTPIINASSGYPVIYDTGVRFDDMLNIQFDERNGITNEVSLDNGLTWNEYTGNEHVASGVIKARSVSPTGIVTESSITVTTQNNAIGANAYDTSSNKDNTAFYATNKGDKDYYMDIDSSAIGKNIRIKQYVYNNINYNCTMSFIDNNGNTIIFNDYGGNSYNTLTVNGNVDNIYIIPNNAKQIKFRSHSVSDGEQQYIWRIYDINIKKEPIINVSNLYPTITSENISAKASINIDYYDLSTNRQYKINNGEWQNYFDGIKLNVGDTIYTRSQDSDGIYSSETAYTYYLPNDAVGLNAFDISSDKDSTAFFAERGANKYYYIDIDSSAIGRNIRIKQYVLNNPNYNCTMSFIDENGNSISFRDNNNNSYNQYTINGNSDTLFIIPTNSKRLKFSSNSLDNGEQQYIWRIYDVSLS